MKKSELQNSPRTRAFALKNLADFQTELFRVIAGHIPGLTKLESRRHVARLVFIDARRVQDLRTRCRELALVLPEIFSSRSVAARNIIEKIAEIENSDVAVAVSYLIVKKHLAIFLKEHLIPELEVFDAPSIAPIEENIRCINEQILWIEKAFPMALAENENLCDELRRLCGQFEHQIPENTSHPAEPVREGRKMGMLPLLRSVIPEGFRELETGVNVSGHEDYTLRSASTALNFLQELQAGDSCASLLFDAPDMPWEFYFDTARHMWDEMRHCEFGELKLRELGIDFTKAGMSNIAYTMRQTLKPLDRYTALTTQEADAFPGKHAGLKDALENNDTLSATAWSYDISDETQHVRFGQRWIPVMIEQIREPRSYAQIKSDAEGWRANVLAASYLPQMSFKSSDFKK